MVNPYDAVFDLLDDYRHFPSYRLESRADIYFALFLPRLIEEHTGKKVTHVIPEFPVRMASLRDPPKGGKTKNLSFKVDFLCLLKESRDVILVELKTDNSSVNSTQIENMEKARNTDFEKLLDGLLKIYQTTSEPRKYDHLFYCLRKENFLTFQKDIIGLPGNKYGKKTWERTKYHAGKIDLIYILPNSNCKLTEAGIDQIIFREAAKTVSAKGGELAERFSISLVEWAEVKAGYR